MRHYKRNRKPPQQFEPVFGAEREYNSESIANIVYMIKYGDYNSNVDTNDILYLLADWDVEYCMDTLLKFHTREDYPLNYQSNYPDTPTHME